MAEKVLTPNKAALVKGVRDYAQEHYNDAPGWDVVVECYSDEEILDVIGESFKLSGVLAKFKKINAVRESYAREIINA